MSERPDFGREIGRSVFGRDAAAYDEVPPALSRPGVRRPASALRPRPGAAGARDRRGHGHRHPAAGRARRRGRGGRAGRRDGRHLAPLRGVEVRVAPFEEVELEDAGLRPGGLGHRVPLDRRGHRRWPASSTHCGRAGGSPSGGRCSAIPTALDAFHHATQGSRRRPARGAVEGRRQVRPGVRPRPRRAPSQRSRRPASWSWPTSGRPGTRPSTRQASGALYGTFSPIGRLADAERERVLDGVEQVAAEEFGGRVVRPFVTAIYSARRPG